MVWWKKTNFKINFTLSSLSTSRFKVDYLLFLFLLNVLVCDMAGIGFDLVHAQNPQNAAKNVQCIHTSYLIGSEQRECHQDWIMGKCGMCQPATDDLMALYCGTIGNCDNEKLFSHNICPYFYNIAFSHDYIADNYYNCTSPRMAKNLPENFKMGYMEGRRRFEKDFTHIKRLTVHSRIARSAPKKVNLKLLSLLASCLYSSMIIGDIPAPTSKFYPYTGH